MRICFLSSEVAPLAKTGGLADVSSALCRELHERGHDVRPFLPLYSSIDTSEMDIVPVEFLQRVPVELGGRDFHFSIYTASIPGSALSVYLVHCPPLFDRDQIYTSDPDEHLRFVLFCRAALESCQGMGWSPQIVHCNDWQSALVPLYLRALYSWDRLFAETRSLLTIHNIGFQGTFPAGAVDDLGMEGSRGLLHQEDLFHGHVNFLKTGLLYANALTTVSPTYAREIQTSDYGMGLEGLLQARKADLVGVLNGVDYAEWSPESDPHLEAPYSAKDLRGKAKNKKALLKEVGLKYEKKTPVLGVVSRLTGQKGFDLMEEALPAIVEERELRLVVLGSGEPRYESFFKDLAKRFPKRVHFHNGFSNALAHRIEAGADVFLMPSRYEPCGLNQMYSLKYGTIPVVRKTGGLADTVSLWDPDTREGTGIVFDHYTPEGFSWAVRAALDLFAEPATWKRLIQNAMAQDFSWSRQTAEYENIYTRLIERRPVHASSDSA